MYATALNDRLSIRREMEVVKGTADADVKIVNGKGVLNDVEAANAVSTMHCIFGALPNSPLITFQTIVAIPMLCHKFDSTPS